MEVRPEEASRRYDHMQFLVKDDCFEASARTKSTSTLYCPAMLARLRENLRTTSNTRSVKSPAMGVTYHLLCVSK